MRSILAFLCALPALAAAPAPAPPETAPDAALDPKVVMEQARAVFEEVKGNSDAAVRRVAFEGALALGTPDREQALVAALAESDWGIRERALTLALQHKDKKLKDQALVAVSGLLASLEKKDREQARALVQAQFKPADAQKLYQKAAVDGDADGRAEARQALIALGGKPAWDVISAGLAESAESPEHKQALAALVDFKDPAAVKWALSHLHDRDALGPLARDLLVRVEDPKAAAEIQKTLQKTYETAQFAERVDAAVVLVRRGNTAPAVIKSLVAGARFTEPAVRLVAWEGLRSVRDPAALGQLRERIVNNEQEDEVEGAFQWFTTWAKANGEPAVIEILQELGKGDRRTLRMRALAALTELKHRPSVTLFESAMSEGQTEVRLAAAKGLAAVARPGDEVRLAGFLRKEPDAQVKQALIEGLGNIGTADILDPLQFVVTAPQKELKVAALNAMAPTGTPKAAMLVGLLKRDPDLDVRFQAWHQLLRIDPKGVAKELPAAIGWLTPGHVQTLAEDPKISPDVLLLLAEKGTDEQRTFAVDGLRKRGDAGATKLLSLVERSAHEDTAAQALEALAEIRKEASVATYREALKSKFPAVRAAAYAAIGRFGPQALLEIVVSGLAEKEPLVRARAAEAAVLLATRKV